jgi:hypothetical protein
MQFLRHNCWDVDCRKGRPICNPLSSFRGHELLLTIVKPERHVLEWLADGNLPHAACNYVECARDLLTADTYEAFQLYTQFIRCHHHNWHGKHRTFIIDDTYYSGQRRAGRWFAAYCDEPSKVTNGPCLHVEYRVQGMRALRQQLGVYHLGSLLALYDDLGGVWKRNLKLVDIDLERLGIYDSNRRSGLKRRKPLVYDYGRLKCNRDKATGGLLFRIFGYEPGKRDKIAAAWIPSYVTIGRKVGHQKAKTMLITYELSVQAFVSQYGKGPFLKWDNATISWIVVEP